MKNRERERSGGGTKIEKNEEYRVRRERRTLQIYEEKKELRKKERFSMMQREKRYKKRE